MDTRQEGVAAPHEPSDGQGTGPSGELEDPEFDPGGETDLPSESDTPHGTPPEGDYDDEGESGPLELEPEVDLEVPPIDPEAAPPATGIDDPDALTHGELAPERPGAEAPGNGAHEAPGHGTPEDPAPEEPAAGKRESPRKPDAKERSLRNGHNGNSDQPRAAPPAPAPAPQPRPPGSHAPSPPPSPVQAAPPSPPAPSVQPAPPAPQAPAAGEPAPVDATQVAQDNSPPPPPPGSARIHVVQPGESLWVIAKRALPPGASMARIAREVNRLWELNEDRIATGDPDLLRIGTELRLR